MTDRIASIRERIVASRAHVVPVSVVWYSERASLLAHLEPEDRLFIEHHSPERIAALLADLEAALAVVEAAQFVVAHGRGHYSTAELRATLSTFDNP